MKYIDLFAGTGAFSYVLSKRGHTCVLANDFCKHSEKIYNVNFPEHTFLCDDLFDIQIKNIPQHDILTGGFPCQPFSIAGNKKGWSDSRSNVFWIIIEILKYHKPKYFILENVANIINHNNNETFNTITDILTKIGYDLNIVLINTQTCGIPQNRERVYILGTIVNNTPKIIITDNVECKPLASISNFLECKVPEKYYYTNRFKCYEKLVNEVTNPHAIYQYRRGIVRENKSGVCPTLTANMGTGGHNVPIILNNGIRKLTPRECFNFQGFPQTYILPNLADSHLYKLAGNAVSIPVVECICNILFSHVDGRKIITGYLCRYKLYKMYNIMSVKVMYKLFNLYKKYVTSLQEINKTCPIKIRMPNFPSEISETIVAYVFKYTYGHGVRWSPVGDLISNGGIKIEVKCFSSNGPSSFGPTEAWDWLYFVDTRNIIKHNHILVYELRKSNASQDWMSIKFNKTETFAEQIKKGRRPRISFSELSKQIKFSLIFNGDISNLL